MPNEETIQKMSIVDPIQVNVNIPNFEGKPGRDGTDGRDGDDAYRIAVRNGFLGTEKEWLLTLKGQDGKSASAPTARQELLKNNIWCEDDTVDSVFAAIISNWGKPMPRTEFNPLRTQSNTIVGNPNVTFTGEPHFKVRLNGSDTEFDTNGNASVTLPSANTGDTYTIEYIGFTNNKISDLTISFGDLSSIFRKGNLIESKQFDFNSLNSIIVSVYDNKFVEFTHSGGWTSTPSIDKDRMNMFKEFILSKIDDIETISLDANITKETWNPYQMSCFEEFVLAIGHGVNIHFDFSEYLSVGYANVNRGELLFNNVGSSDRIGKYYIGKAIQVGNSNIMLLKNGQRNVIYDYNTNTIHEKTNY